MFYDCFIQTPHCGSAKCGIASTEELPDDSGAEAVQMAEDSPGATAAEKRPR
jgi:hypothetical protein